MTLYWMLRLQCEYCKHQSDWMDNNYCKDQRFWRFFVKFLFRRNCYLPNERKLEFFKVYTKANCEHECLAQITINRCKCAQFFMVRNTTMRICGVAEEKCFRNVEDEFEVTKMTCKCLEPCNYVKYEVELKNVEQYFERE